MSLHVDDSSARNIRFAAATLQALADRLAAGGEEDTFVRDIRARAGALRDLVGEDDFYRQVVTDSNRHLGGRTLE